MINQPLVMSCHAMQDCVSSACLSSGLDLGLGSDQEDKCNVDSIGVESSQFDLIRFDWRESSHTISTNFGGVTHAAHLCSHLQQYTYQKFLSPQAPANY